MNFEAIRPLKLMFQEIIICKILLIIVVNIKFLFKRLMNNVDKKIFTNIFEKYTLVRSVVDYIQKH